MALGTLMLISVGVAMDAAAVSAGTAVAHSRLRDAFRLALTFGIFQLAMATLGWVAGAQLLERIAAWDHWVVFALLAFIGGRMIYQAINDGDHEAEARILTMTSLLILGVATSIDSLAVGVTLPMLELSLPVSVGTIGLVTFVISLAAALVARRLGAAFGGKLEIIGGLVLIAIGIKFLIEHLAA